MQETTRTQKAKKARDHWISPGMSVPGSLSLDEDVEANGIVGLSEIDDGKSSSESIPLKLLSGSDGWDSIQVDDRTDNILRDDEKHSFGQLVVRMVGWVAFGVVFNTMNTAVYATLYPKVLQGIDANYDTDFATVNFITTILSSLFLPPIGKIFDELSLVKDLMILTEFGAIFCTVLFLFTQFIPSHLLTVVAVQVLYTVAMFLIRISVMNNNALLSLFPSGKRIGLSLFSNFTGFGVALVELVVMYFVTLKEDRLTASQLISAFSVLVAWGAVVSLLCPSDRRKKLPSERHEVSRLTRVGQVFKLSLIGNAISFKQMCTQPDLRSVLWYLLAYLFFSTPGTVWAIFVTTFFIRIYNISLSSTITLNIYWLASLVVGVVCGLIWKAIMRDSLILDVLVIVVHISQFLLSFLLIYLSVVCSWGYSVSLMLSLYVGVLYGWNCSVARGTMSKLTPEDKKAEFMGFYSTFTYLGIALVSLVFTILKKFDLGMEILCILLFVYMIPSFLFIFLLVFEQMRSSRRKRRSHASESDVDTAKLLENDQLDQDDAQVSERSDEDKAHGEE